jgi:hypothetical protein
VQGVGNPLRERSVFLSPTLSVDLLPTSHSKKVAALQDFCERRPLRPPQPAEAQLLAREVGIRLLQRPIFLAREVGILSFFLQTLSGFLPCLQGTLSERSVFPRALRIENAYVTYSLRCPSRVTVLLGQYPHNLSNSLLEGGEKKFRQLGPP